jgi:hypothetical protein
MGEDGHKLQKRCLPWGLSSHRRSEETGGGRGFIKLEKWGDVIYGWSLIIITKLMLLIRDMRVELEIVCITAEPHIV